MKQSLKTPFLFILGIAASAWHVIVMADTPSSVVPLTQFSDSVSASPVAKPKDTVGRPATLCGPEETIVFSCSLPKVKIVSLCASKDASSITGYMQYRFGRDTSSLELEYPKKKAPPKEFFKYYSSSFSKGGTFGISFRIGGYRYSLFNTRSAFGYNGAGIILNKGRGNTRVSFSSCLNEPIKSTEIIWITPFANSKHISYFEERLGLPKAGSDISYIGYEPDSDLNQPEPGEPEDRRLRNIH